MDADSEDESEEGDGKLEIVRARLRYRIHSQSARRIAEKPVAATLQNVATLKVRDLKHNLKLRGARRTGSKQQLRYAIQSTCPVALSAEIVC
jgi:hypothetical protein